MSDLFFFFPRANVFVIYMTEVPVSQTVSILTCASPTNDFSALALLPYYRPIILIFLPSPFHVFLLTIIPSIKPGWPPWCCWRALSVSCRTWCCKERGGPALAAEGEPRSKEVAKLRFSLLSLGQEGQMVRMKSLPESKSRRIFCFFFTFVDNHSTTE